LGIDSEKQILMERLKRSPSFYILYISGHEEVWHETDRIAG
jgi:hypothetical protein